MITFSPHIAVGVRDYEKAIEFYTNTLGLEVQKLDPQESELLVGDVTLYIENNEQTQVTWLEFLVDDVEALKIKLEAAGCTINKSHLPKSYLVVDPYGMRFHIWQDV